MKEKVKRPFRHILLSSAETASGEVISCLLPFSINIDTRPLEIEHTRTEVDFVIEKINSTWSFCGFYYVTTHQGAEIKGGEGGVATYSFFRYYQFDL